MENFTALRNGILEHRRAGKMPPFDSGIFDHLLTRCNWETGIYHGCALALAFDFGDVSLKEAIQRCLRRLRDRKYVNYPEGTGKRGGYDILIHKYEVAKGKLLGMRLNAWANNGLASPEYEPQNGQHTVGTRSANGRQTVGTPIQDIQDIQDSKELSSDDSAQRLEIPLSGVWSYYLIAVDRNSLTYRFTDSRRQKGRARLKECLSRTGGDLDKAVALMKLAVDSLAASDWHMGRDPKTGGKRYCEWETNLFGSYERMEKWWNELPAAASKPNGHGVRFEQVNA